MAAHFHRVSPVCWAVEKMTSANKGLEASRSPPVRRRSGFGLPILLPRWKSAQHFSYVFICFHMFSLYFRMNFTVISCQSPRSEQVPFGPRQFVKSNRRRFPWRSLERCRQLIRGIVFCCDVRCGDSIYAAKWFEGRLHLGNGSIPSRRGGWEKPCSTHSTRFCKVSGLDTLFGAKPCKTKLSHKIIFGFLRPIVRYFCYEVNKSIK